MGSTISNFELQNNWDQLIQVQKGEHVDYTYLVFEKKKPQVFSLRLSTISGIHETSVYEKVSNK